jgi:hypothetical protein
VDDGDYYANVVVDAVDDEIDVGVDDADVAVDCPVAGVD